MNLRKWPTPTQSTPSQPTTCTVISSTLPGIAIAILALSWSSTSNQLIGPCAGKTEMPPVTLIQLMSLQSMCLFHQSQLWSPFEKGRYLISWILLHLPHLARKLVWWLCDHSSCWVLYPLTIPQLTDLILNDDLHLHSFDLYCRIYWL